MPSKTKPLIYIAAIILSIIFFYPFWTLILIAFEPTRLTFGRLYPVQFPFEVTLLNIINSFKQVDLLGPLIRSFEVAFMVGGLALLLGIPAGYGIAKLTAKISNKLIAFLFIINMMPGLVIAIPISLYFYSAHLENTAVGVALAQELVVLPLSVFILMGGFRSLPRDLENQARVDGASLGSTFYHVLLPLVRIPILIAFVLSWMTSWDEFTYAFIVAPIVPTDSTFPVALYNYVTRDLPLQSATFALIATIPVIILVVVFQKYLKGQYLSGGLVG
jgi:ABC-type glycerol-3-phosphate transport system permease component